MTDHLTGIDMHQNEAVCPVRVEVLDRSDDGEAFNNGHPISDTDTSETVEALRRTIGTAEELLGSVRDLRQQLEGLQVQANDLRDERDQLREERDRLQQELSKALRQLADVDNLRIQLQALLE